MNDTALSAFHPLIQSWFKARYGSPTDIQEKGWQKIALDQHVLMTAPTGSGKTLASFLWSLNQLVCGEWSGGAVRVLYISPLKALNNDVQRNLLQPLGELREYFQSCGESFPEIRVQTRSGDTPSSERQKMMRRPPEIFITTPESLNIMLTSGAAESIMKGLSVVILDEIHGVAGDKRGAYLSAGIERLTLISGEFQRIGLSATVEPLPLVASMLGGFYPRRNVEGQPHARPVEILRSKIQKEYDIRISYPEAKEGEGSRWPVLIEHFVERIRNNRSTLIFSNSRRQTEKVTRMINELAEETIAFAHHGSLSREIRYFVEQKMKEGELKAIVATSSLEMGIDIGSIDEVILIQAPFSLSSAIQRIGRGGHNVGDVSRCTVFPLFGSDLLNCAVTSDSVMHSEIEALKIPENPLDILAQIILSMCCTRDWNRDELYLFITSIYQWKDLSKRYYDLVLEMLNGRYSDSRIAELKPRISIDTSSGTLSARDGMQRVLYLSGGTIPDRGYYELRLSGSNAKIGELDEEFVWERNHGDFFTLGTQTWRVDAITDRAVEVSPGDSGGAMSPFWKADPGGRDYFFSSRILDLLESLEQSLSRDKNIEDNPEILNKLMERYHMDEATGLALLRYLQKQREHTNSPLPHRRHLLIEHYNDPMNRSDCHQVILHTLWGGTLNFPYSEALSQAFEEKHSLPLQVFCDDDAILLDLPHEFKSEDVLNLVSPDNLEPLLRRRLESTMYFGGRFRHNASRALLLPKKSFKQRTPLWLTRLRSKKLLQAVIRYEDFPILTETWRSCLFDDFDLPSLRNVLDEIREGKIKVSEAVSKSPSPFASGIIYDHTNQRMYEDDTPLGGPSMLKDDLIQGIVHNDDLRPLLPEDLIQEFQDKLQRTYPEYAPTASEDILDWLDERIFLPLSEWETLKAAVLRDLDEGGESPLPSLEESIVYLEHPDSSETLVISNIYFKKYGQDGLHKNMDELLPLWLNYFGPIPLTKLVSLYPAPGEDIVNLIESLREQSCLVIGSLTEGLDQEQLCTAENLEILFRLKRRKSRQPFQALPLDKLPLFLAQQQLLTKAGGGKEELQDVMECLIGYGAKASLWESEILPARMKPYYKTWLDTLLHDSSLIWYGCGKEKTAFCFEEELTVFNQSGAGDIEELFPDTRGQFAFWDLKEYSGLSSSDLTKKLWEACWSGQISSDQYATLRSGIQNKFETDSRGDSQRANSQALSQNSLQSRSRSRGMRGGYQRWKKTRPVDSRWFLCDSIPRDEDLLEQDQRVRELIRQLFSRYGVLFRELLERENEPFLWRHVFRTLRLMELSGECVSGHFFEGIQGLQFASWDALRSLSEPLDEEPVYWMNCCDPASLSGVKLDALKGTYPSRLASNHMVFKGDQPLLFSRRNGKDLEFLIEPDNPLCLEALAFFQSLLNREFNALQAVKVELINGQELSASPYKDILLGFGFRDNYKALVLN